MRKDKEIVNIFWKNDVEQIKQITKEDLAMLFSPETINKNFKEPISYNLVKLAIEQITQLKGKYWYYEFEQGDNYDFNIWNNIKNFSLMYNQIRKIYEGTFLFRDIYVAIDMNNKNPYDYILKIITEESDNFKVIEKTKTNNIIAFETNISEIESVIYMQPYSDMAIDLFGKNVDSVKMIRIDKTKDKNNWIEENCPDIFPLVNFSIEKNFETIFSNSISSEIINANRQLNSMINKMQFSIDYDGFKSKIINGLGNQGVSSIKGSPDKVAISDFGDVSGQLIEYGGNANISEFKLVIDTIQSIFNIFAHLPKNSFSLDISNESGISKLIENSPLYKKIMEYRELIKTSEIQLVNSIIKMIYYFKDINDNIPEIKNIEWGELDVLKNEQDEIASYTSAVNGKLMTNVEAIMKYRNVNKEEAELIFMEIMEEQKTKNELSKTAFDMM